MKRAAYTGTRFRVWSLSTSVVILGFALALVSAQEAPPERKVPQLEAETPETVERLPARPEARAEMPDISGVWRCKRPNVSEIEIQRAADGSGDFTVEDTGRPAKTIPAPPVRWIPKAQRFEQLMFAPGLKDPATRIMQLLPDGETLKITVTFDESLQKELVKSGKITEKEQQELLNTEWVRIQPPPPTPVADPTAAKEEPQVEEPILPVDPLKPLSVQLESIDPLTQEIINLFSARGAKISRSQPGNSVKLEAPKDVMEEISELMELCMHEHQKPKPQPQPSAANSYAVNLEPPTLLVKYLVELFGPRGAKVLEFEAGKRIKVEAPGDVYLDLEKMLRLVLNETKKQDELRRTLGIHKPRAADRFTDLLIPDISGTWRVTPRVPGWSNPASVQTSVIRRTDGEASYLVLGEAGVEKPDSLKVTWSDSDQRFEGTTQFDKSISLKQTMRVMPDGKTMHVAVEAIMDDQTRQKIKKEQGVEFPALTLQLWTRQDELPTDAPPRSKIYVPTTITAPNRDAAPGESWPAADAPAAAVDVRAIEGVWQGGEWGVVTIEVVDLVAEHDDDRVHLNGTYYNMKDASIAGTFVLTSSPQNSGRYTGTWKHGGDGQHGRLSLRLLEGGQTIRGSWTIDQIKTTKSEKPGFGDLEWFLMGRIAPKSAADFPPTSKPSGEVSNKSHTGPNRFTKVPASSFTPSVALLEVPGAFELLGKLSRHEATAEQRAADIRQSSQLQGDQRGRKEKAQRDLEQALTDALTVKFQLEQMQIKVLEAQLERLKSQITKRQSHSTEIVTRRARELIEGTSKWNPGPQQ